MNRYVRSIYEALTKAEWLNYKEQTTVGPDSSDDVMRTSELLYSLLSVDDPAALLFTGDDVSLGDDYKYFMQVLVPQAKEIKHDRIPGISFTEYYRLFQYKDKFFVILDIRDEYEYSYLFIRTEDYEFFDKIDKPIVPELSKPVQSPAATPPLESSGVVTVEPGGPLV